MANSNSVKHFLPIVQITLGLFLVLLLFASSSPADADPGSNPAAISTEAPPDRQSDKTEAQTSATQSPPERNAEPALSGDRFEALVRALSGKPVSDSTHELLHNVKAIRRKGKIVELTKDDDSVTELADDTEFGARVQRDIAETKEKISVKLGPDVAKLADKFVGVTSAGVQMTVEREGPDEEMMEFPDRHDGFKVPLRRIRLGRIKFELGSSADGSPMLKNIEGVEVLPKIGFDLPIEVKEFSSALNKDGDEVLSFGVKSPIFKPFRKLFRLKDLLVVTWTIKKAATRDIGAVPESSKAKDDKAPHGSDTVPTAPPMPAGVPDTVPTAPPMPAGVPDTVPAAQPMPAGVRDTVPAALPVPGPVPVPTTVVAPSDANPTKPSP